MNENEMKNATIADIDEVTTPVAAAEDAAAPIQEPAAQDETNTAEVENLAPEAVSAPADDGMDEEDEDGSCCSGTVPQLPPFQRR